MTVTTEETLAFAGGITIALFLFVMLIYPWLVGIVQGQCWKNVVVKIPEIISTMDNLVTEDSKTIRLTLGECVEEFIIANSEQLPMGTLTDYKCELGLPSFIAVKPNIKWFQVLKQVTVEAVCRKILCGESECHIQNVNEVILLGPGEKESSVTYNLKITKELQSDSYAVFSIEVLE